ncbi:MAG: flippase-like domain-containing protein [Planctomycetia bacterium]|nr:flippase-like domain-containing protein [Planctomycetia bacterium]
MPTTEDANPTVLADSSAAASAPAQETQPRHWRWLIFTAKIAVAGGLIAWLCLDRLDLRRLAVLPRSSGLALLGLAALGSMLLPAVRWWCLLRLQKIDTTLWQATKLTWIGYATALVLPGAASADVAKSYLIVRQRPDAWARGLSTVLVDRFLGLYSLILLGCTSAGWLIASRHAAPYVWAAFGPLAAVLAGTTGVTAWVMLTPPWRLLACVAPRRWIDAGRESLALYRQAPGPLAICLMLSLAGSILTAGSLALAARLLGSRVDWAASFLIGPLVVLANCLPLTPGGIGVAEATASELFSQAGCADGAEMMLSLRLIMATLSLPAILALLGRRPEMARLSPPLGAGSAPDARSTDIPSARRAA